MPEKDHYEIARDKALGRLRERVNRDRLDRLGAELSEDRSSIAVPLLCWGIQVRLDPYRMALQPGGQEVALVWQILTLEYLSCQNPVPPRGFQSFADFPDGRSYQSAFAGRVTRRLSKGVGREREPFVEALEELGCDPGQGEPLRCIIRFFPLLEFQVVRYEGDEDFSPSCNVLLPDNMLTIFSLEDGIVAAERLVAAMEGRTPAER